jgi:hypothetical protein
MRDKSDQEMTGVRQKTDAGTDIDSSFSSLQGKSKKLFTRRKQATAIVSYEFTDNKMMPLG